MRFKIVLLLVLFTNPSWGQSAPVDLATLDAQGRADILGDWMVKDAEGTRSCKVTLTDNPTIGGYVIEFVPSCVKTFPVMDGVASWRYMEGAEIVFADAERKSLIRFYTPDASYVAEPETDGIATIERLGGTNTSGLTAKNQVGLWDMQREGGKFACRIELTDMPAGNSKFTANLQTPCDDAGIRDFAPLFWSVEADHLTLYGGTGLAVGFVYDLDGDWRKDPPSGRELVLTKSKEP